MRVDGTYGPMPWRFAISAITRCLPAWDMWLYLYVCELWAVCGEVGDVCMGLGEAVERQLQHLQPTTTTQRPDKRNREEKKGSQ